MVIFAASQHAKSSFNHLLFNRALFRKNLRELIKGPGGDILLAISKRGAIRGLLMVWHESLTWTHAKYSTDIHFVAEQGGDILILAWKKWAKERGCVSIVTGTFNGIDEDRIQILFNRLGFKTVGHTFQLEL